MNYLRQLNLFGKIADIPYDLIGETDPTSATEARSGMGYFNKLSRAFFICVDDTPGAYIWIKVAGGGNSSENTGSGELGVGITSITPVSTSDESNGVNVYAINLTDGSSYNIEVRNGSAGKDYVLTEADKAEIAGMVDVPTISDVEVVQVGSDNPENDTYAIRITCDDGSEYTAELPALITDPSRVVILHDGTPTDSTEGAKHQLLVDTATLNIYVCLGSSGIGTMTYYTWQQIQGAVTSVNGKTGAVKLVASDVGALPDSTKIPAKTSDIQNDSGFVNNTVSNLTNYYLKSETYTREEVAALIAAVKTYTVSVVSELPSAGAEKVIYLVVKEDGSDGDAHNEYLWVDGKFEFIGTTAVDLTGYAKEDWVSGQLTNYLKTTDLQSAIDTALAQAKESGEFDGEPGVSPTVSVSTITGGHRITLTDKEGTKTVDVMDGSDGDPGRGITSVKRTSGTGAAGTMDIYTITYSDNTTSTFSVYNGADGKNYTLTEADKNEIAQQAAGLVDVDVVVKSTEQTFTDDEKAQVRTNIGAASASDVSELSDKIDNLQSQGVQQTPSYAESIDWLNENGDTSKLYVLPDGYIYNYTTKTVVTEPTNRVPLSINADKTSFENGKGWKTGCTLSAGDGSERTDYSYYEVSGFISVTAHDTFCIKNFEWASPYNTYDNITFYDSSFNYIGAFTGSSSYNPLPQFLKDDGTFEACIATAATTNFSDTKKNSIAYIRLAFKEISDNTILTINEPLETTTTTITGWHSTGHAFVPADYEEDIIDLNRRVSVLEVGGTGTTIENYIVEEAERVAKNVYSHQNANTFTFLAISDMHYIENYSNVAQSIIHAGQGMDLVRKNVNVDFAVCLGDNGWGSGVEGSEYRATIEKGIEELRSANACIDSAFRGIPNFRSVGNHCSLIFNYTFNNNDYLDASELFPLYGAYNRGAVFPVERERGYCYRDFEDWKLRVICMNTSDLKDLTLPDDMQKPVYVSGTQGKWFAETLDLSGKNNAEEWSILILSHAPLDWGSSCIYLCDILKAYKEGNSCSIERNGITISYDYAGKNAATIIGNCHGHNHNFQVDYLRRYVGDNTTEAIDIKRFGIPNACFDRTNEKGENDTTEVWDIEYGETTSYEKVAGTAQDTAFCVVTIDPVERKIYADCYGAGYNREIEY